MQTYGLKIGDRVRPSSNAGKYSKGYCKYDIILKQVIFTEPIRKDFCLSTERYYIVDFIFYDGATYVLLNDGDYGFVAHEVEKVPERDINSVQVGDWITIIEPTSINGFSNWRTNPMDKYIGHTVKVTAVTNYSSAYKMVSFKGYGYWEWETMHKHFRFATEDEIANSENLYKEINFGDYTINFGDYTITLNTLEGIGVIESLNITFTKDDLLEIIEKVIPEIYIPKDFSPFTEKLGYNITCRTSLDGSLEDIEVRVGCQVDTLQKLLTIYNLM